MYFACLELTDQGFPSGNLLDELFDVESSEIDYVREEMIGTNEIELPVAYLKDGRRCIPISTWEDPEQAQKKREFLRSLIR